MIGLALNTSEFQLVRQQAGAAAVDAAPTVGAEDWDELVYASGAKSLLFYWIDTVGTGTIDVDLWVRDGVNNRYLWIETVTGLAALTLGRFHTRAGSPLYLQVSAEAADGDDLSIWAYASEEW